MGSAWAMSLLAHEVCDKVLDNDPHRIGIWKCWFLRRQENQSTWTKTSWSKDEGKYNTSWKN